MNRETLTKSEREIMDLLWRVERPLSASEIIELSPTRSWKASYVHILINSLIEKEMICPTGLAKTTRNYARVFIPAISQTQYIVRRIADGRKLPAETIIAVAEDLLNEAEDYAAAVTAMKKLLDAKKRALKTDEK